MAEEENRFGASNTEMQEVAEGVLNTLPATKGKEKVDKDLARFLYFSKMAELAGKPGSTLLSSASGAFTAPAQYMLDVKERNNPTTTSFGTPGTNVQSALKYNNGAIIYLTKAGERVVISPEGKKVTGVDAAKVAQDAINSGIAEKGAQTFAQEQSKQAVDMSGKALESTTKISANIRNLSKAKDAIVRGAGTGFIQQMLPDFTAASIELSNIRSNLGLDVVGSVVFGALSKGELDLALSTALPIGLSEPDLIDFVERKIIAQTKLKDYFQEQALYLGTRGNTVAGWMEKQQEKTEQNAAFSLQQIKDMSDEDLRAVTPEQILTLSNESLAEYTKRRNALR